MKYCDIHTHILPKMDDGSKSISESAQLISRLNVYGVDAIAFTSHYYSNKESIESFVQRRTECYEDALPNLPRGVKYTLGAEVFVTDLLFSADDITPLCYNNTRYMLTELSYDITIERALNYIEMLQSKYSVVPIIAHIERYPNILAPNYVSKLVDNGAFVQTNIDSVASGFFQRKKIVALAESGLIHFLGTDTHSIDRRCPDFAENVQKIVKYIGKEFFKECMLNAYDLFEND